MTKSELVQRMARQFPKMTLKDIERAVDLVFEEITVSLASGGRVELRGFGAFSVRYRDQRLGRNPRTGESVQVDGKYVPFFKAGKGLRERLNKEAS